MEHGFWYPFRNAYDYKLARSLLLHPTSKTSINSQFSEGILGRSFSPWKDETYMEASFTSAHTLFNRAGELDTVYDEKMWQKGTASISSEPKIQKVEYWYRDPMLVIENLLNQNGFREHYVWEPIQDRDAQSNRVYSELHTADWWFELQVC